MAANTIAMYFKCDPVKLRDPESLSTLEGLGVTALGALREDPLIVDLGGPRDKLIVFQAMNGGHATMRVYSHGLVTLDIQYFVENPGLSYEKQTYNCEYIRALARRLENHLGELCMEANSLYCPIRRGQKVWPYAVTADERLQELDYDELVFEKTSEFQNIRIFHSKEHGNVLYLDGDAMLGESDLVYTQTLCCIPEDSYAGKEVLILGGGDGGILHELLKENPKFITMAEIDEEVVKACRTHLRSVCGADMDKLEGPHHKIVLDDCVAVLHQSITNEKLYDYVINDLTEFPVDKQVKGFGYDFETSSLITELSLKALKPGGKLLARGNCLSAVDYREIFEDNVKAMNCHFKRKDVFVPSFEETYCLYEIWKLEENGLVINGAH